MGMRIELPSSPWADTAPRAEDDAHTMTIAGHSASDWAPLQLLPEADDAQAVRTRVATPEPVILTLTL